MIDLLSSIFSIFMLAYVWLCLLMLGSEPIRILAPSFFSSISFAWLPLWNTPRSSPKHPQVILNSSYIRGVETMIDDRCSIFDLRFCFFNRFLSRSEVEPGSWDRAWMIFGSTSAPLRMIFKVVFKMMFKAGF